MEVDINWVLMVKARLREINNINIKDIQWVHNDEYVYFSNDDIEEFDFMGLGSTCILEDYKFTKSNPKLLEK
jgi:hypothetical protein